MTDSYQSFPQGDFVGRPEIDSKFTTLYDGLKSLSDRMENHRAEHNKVIINAKAEYKETIQDIKEQYKVQLHYESKALENKFEAQEKRMDEHLRRLDDLIRNNTENMEKIINKNSEIMEKVLKDNLVATRWTVGIIVGVVGSVAAVLQAIL